MSKHFEPLGQFLRNARISADLSQDEVAQTLGFSSPQFISNWERGKCKPPLKSLEELCSLYKIQKRKMIEEFMKCHEHELKSYLKPTRRASGN